MKDLIVLKIGALSIQVCTSLKNKKDIEAATNYENLCGTVNGWKLYEKESKRLGQPMVKCANDSKRRHYILYA
jgi:hypothetical protein